MPCTNSLVTIALEVYSGLFKDIQSTYPLLDLSRDMQRLRSQVQTRGLGFLTLDLPNLDKILLSGLDKGFLTLQGPQSQRISRKAKVPRFLAGLWLKVFDNEGILKDDADVTAIFFLRQAFCLCKKLMSKAPDKAIRASLEEFYDVDSSLRSIELYWFDVEDRLDNPSRLSFFDGLDNYPGVLSSTERHHLSSDLRKLERVFDTIASTLGYYDPYSFTGVGANTEGYSDQAHGRSFKHGPGAVADKRYGTNKYHFPSWPTSLQNVFPFDAYGSHNFCVSNMPDEDHALPSKIIAVPKTADKPRLIASEPTALQWCQQITRHWLDNRLAKTWLGSFIDLHDQSKSAKMVSESSLDRHLCTIDLSSASDRLSAWSVLRAFRKNPVLLRALRAHRNYHSVDTFGVRSKPVILNKFATQGTAVTFPVQSIFFLGCALAVSCEHVSTKDILALVGKVRTFGDDIIMPSSGYERMCVLLEYLDLKVNKAKSFATGFFRESCGSDCYKGYDVTPCKPKTFIASHPEAVSAVLDTVNNLYSKGLWHASEALRKQTIDRLKLPIKGPASGVIGLVSFCGEKVSHLLKRWNPNLQRDEYRVHSVIAKNTKSKSDDGSNFFQYIAERPRPETQWESGFVVRSLTKLKLRWEGLSDTHVAHPSHTR